MNCCFIWLLLLLCGNNGNWFGGNGNSQNDCGCDDRRPCPPPRPDCDCDDRRPCPPPKPDCGCDDGRFEPRFEQRPFNGTTCGCEEN